MTILTNGEFKSVMSERIVLGILINNPNNLMDTKGLKFAHIWDKCHSNIFYVIQKLFEEGFSSIDGLSILARAEKGRGATELIEDSGGLEYIEYIKELVKDYTTSDMHKHIEIIIASAYKREQFEQKEKFLTELTNNIDWTVADINNYLQERKFELQSKYSVSGDARLIGDMFDEVWAEIIESRGKDGIVGLPSKIDKVNEYFTYRNGELVILGARAKFGKSNFGINEAHNLEVVQGIPVAYIDTEMNTRTFLARILSIDSGVPLRQIEDGSYQSDVSMVALVETSKERIKKAPLIHKYSYYWDKQSVRDMALLLQARYGIKFLIYDYIKVKEVGSTGANEHSELGNWTIFLKDLAGEMDIPILSFGQLSPYEIRLADSDKINRYASTIAYLLPKEPQHIARDGGVHMGGSDYLYVDYNRNGASMDDTTKGINLFYTRYNVTFEQAETQVLDDDGFY